MGSEQILDGAESLREVLRRVGYRTELEAVAGHTVFLHPETVVQTGGAALFAVTRTKNTGRGGSIVEGPNGRRAMLDDIRSPTDAFLWTAQQRRGPDLQFNHFFKAAVESDTYSADPDIYTAFWNICVTPAFLAKLTDVKHHAHVLVALQRRSYDLYGYLPAGQRAPEPPAGYDSLTWRDCPPPVADLERSLRRQLNRAP